MADPVIDTSSFQPQLNPNRQQFAEAFDVEREKKKEGERIRSFIEKRREEVGVLKDEVQELKKSNDESKIARVEAPVISNFPEDEKTENRLEEEKKERYERVVKSMDGDYLKELEKDLVDYRKVYASIEISDNNSLSLIRGFFGNKNKNVEESIAVGSARQQYQKTLERFKDAKITELKEKGLSGEPFKKEITELIKQFGCMESLELNNARTEAKAELKMGGNVAEKCWGFFEKIENTFNKLPLWAKLGISAGVFASGSYLLIAGKRVLGGITTGVATAKGLDALYEAKAKRAATKDVEKVIGEMSELTFEGSAKENAEKRYELMRKALDLKLANADAHLKNKQWVSLCNKFIGAGVGLFLGSGMASKAMGGVMEYFNQGEHVTGAAALTKSAVSSSENVKVSTILEKPLVIEKGSSIERTLVDHIKATHPDIKNPGQAAHRMWLDYMHDNKDEIIKNVGSDEYQKMFKDGMVNVKPGTTLIIDENNPLKLKLHDIGGKISHIEHLDSGVDSAEHINASSVALKEVNPEVSSETLQNANHEFAKIETEMQTEGAIKELGAKIDAENMRVDQNVSVADGFGQETFGADTFEHRNELVDAKKHLSELLSNFKAEDAPWKGMDSVSELVSKDAGSHQILQTSLDKITNGQGISKLAYWNKIKDLPFESVLFKGEDVVNNENAIALMAEFDKILGGEKVLPLKDSFGNPETTRKWLARVTDLALKAKK